MSKYNQQVYKNGLLCFIFALLVGALILVKELQSSIFMSTVGVNYLPIAKSISMVLLIPFIVMYSYIVERFKNYQLLLLYTFIFSMISLVFTYVVSHPTIGLPNTDIDLYRMLGWVFYFYVDSYFPFVISVFWAFTNSVSTVDESKYSYSFIVSSSKVGGMLSSFIAYYVMKENWSFCPNAYNKVQIILVINGIMLFTAGVCAKLIAMNCPNVISTAVPPKQNKLNLNTVVSGLKMLKSPYVLGIFSTIFFFEVISQMINYQRLVYADKMTGSIDALNSKLYSQVFYTQILGFIVSLLGTPFLIKMLGVKNSILSVPIFILAIMSGFIVTNSETLLIVAYACTNVISYAIATPLRESMYIVTTKEIQFKSKSWIDSVGINFSKAFGQQVNISSGIIRQTFSAGTAIAFNNFIILLVLSLWTVSAYLLGRRYDHLIKNNKLEGSDEPQRA